MSSAITLDRLVRTNPPVYQGRYGGKVLEVRLDSSAVLKLEGTATWERLTEILDPPPAPVTDAARRLIEMRQVESTADGIVVTISALDLN